MYSTYEGAVTHNLSPQPRRWITARQPVSNI